MTNLESLVDSLRNNYLFQLSLGSKELFHSNLIAWLFEQKSANDRHPFLESFIKHVLGIDGDIIFTNQPKVIREYENMDIVIISEFNDSIHYFFIEVKVKSIAERNQLSTYNAKIHSIVSRLKQANIKPHRLLLTPTPQPAPLVDPPWTNIAFSTCILDSLNESIRNDFENKDVSFLTVGYLQFINDLILLLEFFPVGDSFMKGNFDYYTNDIYNSLKNARLHDLILKRVHEQLAIAVKNHLGAEDVITSFDFTKGFGITDIILPISDDKSTRLGIQVQGKQYRHFVQTTSKNIASNVKLADALYINKLWFHKNGIPFEGKGRNKNLYINSPRNYCEYSAGSFIYLYDSINADVVTNSELVERIVSDITDIKKNHALIVDLMQP